MSELLPRRSLRCGLCYWALYDGDWCQNKECRLHGNSIRGQNLIELSNDEAQILINTRAESAQEGKFKDDADKIRCIDMLEKKLSNQTAELQRLREVEKAAREYYTSHEIIKMGDASQSDHFHAVTAREALRAALGGKEGE